MTELRQAKGKLPEGLQDLAAEPFSSINDRSEAKFALRPGIKRARRSDSSEALKRQKGKREKKNRKE
ncbi:hypothetical protein K0M31_000473 [Melipona bicolor]|uniref:Uncharacterized protein n=1 Tax=Melipona bicolor TaxID=60889 RepID=A0AA40GDM4_9HYME|nr:hypothetical protein K0M31_000473 [Melipona bicolor]